MTKYITVLAALATVAAFGVAAYKLGAGNDAELVRINIQNSLEDAVSNLSEDQQRNAKQVIEPVLDIVSSTEKNSEKATENLSRAFSELTIVSYLADKSPFAPPKQKVQYVCDRSFSFTYSFKYSNSNKIEIKINGNTKRITPGDVDLFESLGKKLEITYLEYNAELDNPIIEYKCS